MSTLYPEIRPFNEGTLKVSEIHTIYFEECGNPKGQPVVFLHGGPGGGCTEDYRRYFDPQKWRIILFDQRGCGRSTPFAELQENTTWDLVSDIEKIRKHLDISKWAVFGGSWGSTLALSYGITHPDSCTKFFLRGIFTLRKKELHWFYQEGASFLFPDAWETYLEPIPENERGNLIEAYYKKLTDPNEEIRFKAAKAWSQWEAMTSKLYTDESLVEDFGEADFAVAFARIECHYFINKGFFKTDNWVLDNVDKIKHLPCVIVQGRYDVVCPPQTSWELHKAWPEADYHMIPDAGHSLSEEGIQEKIIEYTDKW